MNKEQVANAGSQKWDYCAPKTNYADVRQRVRNAFAEKALVIADAIDIVQGLSKETARLFSNIHFVGVCEIPMFCSEGVQSDEERGRERERERERESQ
jgi:hypothetical protein